MLIIDQIRKDDARLRTLALVVLSGMATLLAGLWYVQVVASRRYEASLETQTFRTVRIPAVRGKILDRNGLVVAENRPDYNLSLYIEELRNEFDREFTRERAGHRLTKAQRAEMRNRSRYAVVSNTVQQVAAMIQQPLNLSEAQFRRHHDQWPYRPLPILENLNETQIARFLEQGGSVPGVDLEIQPIRYYPQSAIVSHLLGYLSRDDLVRDDDERNFNYSLSGYTGEIGIEYSYDKPLAGKAGIKSVVVDSLSYRKSETVWTPAEPGENVVLALDLPIQKATFDALSSAGANVRGAALVMDALSGDILAMVSLPAYDPNEFVVGVSAERYRDKYGDPKLRPMFNRATQGAYQPGSIFKIITALACLESGVLTPISVTNLFSSPGYYMIGGRPMHDTASAGDYDFKTAFKKSSNTYFINFGLKAGRDRLLEMGHRFHLGEKVPIGTRQDGTSGFFPTVEEVIGKWSVGNVANMCIGQEITVTPLQMALMTAAVANGGKVLQPRLVLRVEPPEPGLEETQTNVLTSQIRGDLGVRPEYLQIVRDAMLADTEEEGGTGFAAFHSHDRPGERGKNLRVCGKTGTAQIQDAHTHLITDHITWFASFAPYESPRYVVIVMVKSGDSGGGTCAPIAHQIYQAIQKRIAPNWSAAKQLATSK